ncbi:S8 family peptidase [Pedobacter duraquae]|uniref:Subtilase family protein n=1 Tax=Pedobacter duraquae TaxID=425511 RepID=A0A4R6IMI2_9SPHI|nr:S8 family peptidase [Pedobacter duraquae]TDO23363.1 subtilase family protein [Pedobacter duraquae]
MTNPLKHICWLLLLCSQSLFSQSKKVILPPNWYNLDRVESGYFGISTEKAYRELLKDKKPKKEIIVAVLDGGVDVNHEDLKDVIWTNPKEIPGNGIDDDGNGYIDDIHGWNFIGSAKGNLAYDNLELVRIYRKLTPKYRSMINANNLDSLEKTEFALYRKVTAELGKKYDDAHQTFRVLDLITKMLDSVARVNQVKVPTLEQMDAYKPADEEEEQVKKIIRSEAKDRISFERFWKDMRQAYKEYDVMLRYNLNPAYNEREQIVGDDYANANQRNYGNNDVKGPNAEHGSHVSGIIAALRNNNIGINGIADHVKIMAIRIVPEGDERDKDVANGIRYAADNGARIINMSFGKNFKWDKKAVDEAVKYAASKGVLLVHASGNDNANIDVTESYPTRYYDSPEALAYQQKLKKDKPATPLSKPNFSQMTGRYGAAKFNKEVPLPLDTLKFKLPHAENWIEVGASTYKDNEELKADFSNYGKHTVDVFAPGFMINSTVPDSKYDEFDGTSMAAPVVSGLAALILGYYPDLSAVDVKQIIMQSVEKIAHKVRYKNEKDEGVRQNFSDICISGGVVNAYQALKLAESYRPKAK